LSQIYQESTLLKALRFLLWTAQHKQTILAVASDQRVG
jgi:hypothetical protein